ncbi:hypothetical protein BJX62DRAFT_236289 [Aspergillus germanicus]
MPDREDAPFDENLGLFSALAAVKPTSTEPPVSILWTNICGTYFHPDAGFKTVVTRIPPQDNTPPDPIVRRIQVIRVTLVGTSDFDESPALHIECRRPSMVVAAATGRKVKFWTNDLHLLSLSDILDLGRAHAQNEAIRVFNRVLNRDDA